VLLTAKKGGYIQEEELINQLAALFDAIDVMSLGFAINTKRKSHNIENFVKISWGSKRRGKLIKKKSIYGHMRSIS